MSTDYVELTGHREPAWSMLAPFGRQFPRVKSAPMIADPNAVTDGADVTPIRRDTTSLRPPI